MNSPGFLEFIGDREIHTELDARNYIEKAFMSAYEDPGYGYYLIDDKQGVSMGIAGFLNKQHLQYEDYGFAFLPEFSAQGFAFEASDALLNHAKEQFELGTLDAETLQTNKPSQRLLERLGFELLERRPSADNQPDLLVYRRR